LGTLFGEFLVVILRSFRVGVTHDEDVRLLKVLHGSGKLGQIVLGIALNVVGVEGEEQSAVERDLDAFAHAFDLGVFELLIELFGLGVHAIADDGAGGSPHDGPDDGPLCRAPGGVSDGGPGRGPGPSPNGGTFLRVAQARAGTEKKRSTE
jgi:hypothetical protein